MYSLTIKRYNRHLSFGSAEELIEELSSYLTQSEIASGVLAKLTDFSPNRRDADGFVVNHWCDFRTDCYVGDLA